MDVVTAFLAGYLTEESTWSSRKDLKLKGIWCASLYRLNQAPRVWNLRIREYLKSIGFTQTYSDPCVYINKTTGIILAMWVDDFIIFGENIAFINDLKATL